jgi:hypothetical protein
MLVTVNSRDLMAKQRRWRHGIPIVMMQHALLRGHRREGRRLGQNLAYRTQCERMRWPRLGGGRHRVTRGDRIAFDVSGSLPIHRHPELSPTMTEPIGRLVIPAMDVATASTRQ